MKTSHALLAAAALSLAPSALAQTDLSGCWRNVRNDVGPCYIYQQGNSLQFVNEHGSQSRGWFYGPYNVVASDWRNDRAQVVANGNVLVWDGNGEWDRDYGCSWGRR